MDREHHKIAGKIACLVIAFFPSISHAQDTGAEVTVTIESEWDGGSNSDHYIEDSPRRVIGLDQNFDGRIDKQEYLDFMVGKLEYNALSISLIGQELISTGDLDGNQSDPSQAEIEERRAHYEAEYDRRMQACWDSAPCLAEMTRRGAVVVEGDPGGT